jgi:hypothetical protein
MRRRRSLAILAGTAALAVGCGGGGDRLSREELVSQADAICTRYDEQLEGLREPESIADVERFAAEARAIIRRGVDELRELEPPEDLEEDYDRWVATNEDALDLIDELEQAAAERDAQRVQELIADAERQDDEADKIARRIGLDDCADD